MGAICLPLNNKNILTKHGAVTGWKNIKRWRPSLKLLKTFHVMMVNNCKKAFPNRNINEKYLCVYGKSSNSCFGDSGGPLQIPSFYNNDFVVVQYGIVSFGKKNSCFSKNSYTVHVNLSSYVNWILQTIKP